MTKPSANVLGPGERLIDDTNVRQHSAVFLSEALSHINDGAGFLDRLKLDEIALLRRAASTINFTAGETIFLQGDVHSGIFVITSGRVRIYYAGPTGKEITLAYWTPGHFIGGPEIFGGGLHMWSAEAVEQSKLDYLPAAQLRHLAATVPNIALALIEGLVTKGKCYSALVQMLGTRSITERLAQLLIILATTDHSGQNGHRLVVDRNITHEQLAAIVGSTRQWVTSTLARFQRTGLIRIERDAIFIERPEKLPLEN
ncbi:MAG: Crp/Fnr family transcriptional regulator [Hyphomicrobiaceae bacterium]|nr:Crp/Fnr family transcriptional regulator [Hyphomicrobiaceae bacterium]